MLETDVIITQSSVKVTFEGIDVGNNTFFLHAPKVGHLVV